MQNPLTERPGFTDGDLDPARLGFVETDVDLASARCCLWARVLPCLVPFVGIAENIYRK